MGRRGEPPRRIIDGDQTVKKILFCVLVIIYVVWDRGYHGYIEDFEEEITTFEKKYFSLQTKFHNVFDMREKSGQLADLTNNEREKIIDYCKYRFGIITKLSTSEELQRCK